MESRDSLKQLHRDFFEMSKWAFVGGVLGIVLGQAADSMGLVGNPLAEGIVRLVSGTMDSIAEIIFIIRNRIRGKRSKAEAYVYGTFIGTIVAPITHLLVRDLATKPYGVAGAIYAFAYGNSDNLFGSLVFLLTYVRKERSFRRGWKVFWSEAFQRGNVLALSLIACGDVVARIAGFVPIRNIWAGVEAAVMDADTVVASVFSIRSQSHKAKQAE